MKEHLALYFLLTAILLSGVLVTSYPYIKDEKSWVNESRFWVLAIFADIVALLCFSYGTFFTKEAIKSNSVVFTFANAIYIASIGFQTLFCWSLNREVPKKAVAIFMVFAVILGFHFEYLRGSGQFVGRVLEIATISALMYVIQLIWLFQALGRQSSTQLKLLTVFTVFELGSIVLRVYIAATQVNPVNTFGEIPFPLVAALWINIIFNVLSFLTMSGYWSERAAIRRMEMRTENERIQHLLEEREHLVGSLLLANKSTSTGALSASIAHELNQPIGASRINLFTLKNKLEKSGLGDTEIVDILSRMEADNKRAGDIVSTLRAIFSQDIPTSQNVGLLCIVNEVLNLLKSELDNSQIELHVVVPDKIEIVFNPVELQQIILNLLNNAIHALNSVGQMQNKAIWIGASIRGDSIELTVEDNGPGISNTMASNLFNLFSSDKKVGMGLGLWLCQYISRRYSGDIAYQPRKSGGSIFTVLIPTSKNFERA